MAGKTTPWDPSARRRGLIGQPTLKSYSLVKGGRCHCNIPVSHKSKPNMYGTRKNKLFFGEETS